MLCCPLLLDMACHTTWYWHPRSPPRTPRPVPAPGGVEVAAPQWSPEEGQVLGVFHHPSHWTIPHCDDLSWLLLLNVPVTAILFFFFLTLEWTIIYHSYTSNPELLMSWRNWLIKEARCCISGPPVCCFTHETFKIGLRHFLRLIHGCKSFRGQYFQVFDLPRILWNYSHCFPKTFRF